MRLFQFEPDEVVGTPILMITIDLGTIVMGPFHTFIFYLNVLLRELIRCKEELAIALINLERNDK
jgi:hypothetical protein